MKPKIHKTAEVSKNSIIGDGTKVWNNSQIRENTVIGKDCVIGKNVYIDKNVLIGDKVKIQNNVSIFNGVKIDSGVFIGPHVVFTNDKFPRAINPNGSLKTEKDWMLGNIHVKFGASIGANSTILPGIVIGRFALIGAGSVVTKNVADFHLVYGNPAKSQGKIKK
jgi:UDP-2-acetamido-3-amino-2,3-dideoxy-glucuronate N-acetyltransferase